MATHAACGHLSRPAAVMMPARPARRQYVTGHGGDSPGFHGRDTSPAWLRWARGFPGDPGQVRQARYWAREILPSCPSLNDVIEIISELAANAVTHTRSSEPGGRFGVELAWFPGLVRVIVGDQGAPSAPRLIEEADGTSGRGLLIVDRLSRAWGIAGDPPGRWVWADIPWVGGPPVDAPGDRVTVASELIRLRRAYAEAPVWYGQATGEWLAVLPGAGNASKLMISAPTPAVLDCLLARGSMRRPAPDTAHIPAGTPWAAHLPGAQESR